MSEQESGYVPQGTANMNDVVDGYSQDLTETRLWLVQSADGDLAFHCALQPEGESDEDRLFEVPTTRDEAADLITEWLGAKTAQTVISLLGASPEQVAKNRSVKDVDGARMVHLYTPRARNAFLQVYGPEVQDAPEADVSAYFPSGEFQGFGPRRTPEQWAAINTAKTLKSLVEDGTITKEQAAANLVKDGHIDHLF